MREFTIKHHETPEVLITVKADYMRVHKAFDGRADRYMFYIRRPWYRPDSMVALLETPLYIIISSELVETPDEFLAAAGIRL